MNKRQFFVGHQISKLDVGREEAVIAITGRFLRATDESRAEGWAAMVTRRELTGIQWGIIAEGSAAATKPAGSKGKGGESPVCKDTEDKDGDVCADLASVKEAPISISELCLLLSHRSGCYLSTEQHMCCMILCWFFTWIIWVFISTPVSD